MSSGSSELSGPASRADATPWDDALAAADVAVHEKAIVGVLLADLL
jgi:hypothetical protein